MDYRDPELVKMVESAVASALSAQLRRIAPKYLSPTDAATYLGGVSTKTLANWRALKIGPRYVRLGRKVAYAAADLEAFVAEASGGQQ